VATVRARGNISLFGGWVRDDRFRHRTRVESGDATTVEYWEVKRTDDGWKTIEREGTETNPK
jgi:hypothetical protein